MQKMKGTDEAPTQPQCVTAWHLSFVAGVQLNVLFTHYLLNWLWRQWTAKMKKLQLMMLSCPSLPWSNNAIRRGSLTNKQIATVGCRKNFLTTSQKMEAFLLWGWAVQNHVLVKARQKAKDVCWDMPWEMLSGWWWCCPWQSLLERLTLLTLGVWPDWPCTRVEEELQTRYRLMRVKGCCRPDPSLLAPMHGHLHRQRCQHFIPCASYWLLSFLFSQMPSGIMTLKGNSSQMALAISNLHDSEIFISAPFKEAPLVEDYCVSSCENMMNLSADTSLTVCLSQLTWTGVVGWPWLVTGAY